MSKREQNAPLKIVGVCTKCGDNIYEVVFRVIKPSGRTVKEKFTQCYRCHGYGLNTIPPPEPFTGVPDTYRTQDGCHNCARVFRWLEHDSGEQFYCTADGKPRPPSGSVALGEAEDWPAWGAWSNEHYVMPAGICDLWQPAVPEGEAV